MADEQNTTTTNTDTTGQQQQAAKPEAKFTQEEMNSHASSIRKEAEDRTRKAILKDLGVDPDDPEAVKAVKGKLTAAQKAEDEKKTTEQRLQEEIDTLKQERDTEKQRAAQIAAERLADKVDNKLRSLAKGVNEKVASADDVVDWLRLKKKSDVEKLVNDDGVIDDKAAEKLVADFKKEKPSWFAVTSGVGSPSMKDGQRTDTGKIDETRARIMSQRNLRG